MCVRNVESAQVSSLLCSYWVINIRGEFLLADSQLDAFSLLLRH
jgi:hypothetical protein